MRLFDVRRGLTLVEVALGASTRAGLPALRSAFIWRMAQSILLLGAGLLVETGTSAAGPIVVAALLGVFFVGAAGPGAVLAASEPERPVHRRAAAGAAILRGVLVLVFALGPAAMGATALAVLDDDGVRVVVALVSAPIVFAGALAGLVLAARLGPAPLLAARGAPPLRVVRDLARRSAPLVPQVVLLSLEILAAGIATTAMGLLTASVVFEAPWSALLALELEAAASWRLLSAPVLVLSVFVQAACLADPGGAEAEPAAG